ncbi:MAG TPA: nuclear transport factor 2 family protein [Spongiibacteraceae bacterium]|nr:nuclear transport factor 2 family protein [Spongiibacteraceae bacterium]
MSEIERNKQFARDLFAAISRGDTAAIVAAYTDDGGCETMGNTLISGFFDKAQIAAAAGSVLGAFPQGIEFTIKHLTAEEDRVAVEAESHGVHVSGKVYHNYYHFLLLMRDGKLVRLKEYMDTELITEVLCGGQRR